MNTKQNTSCSLTENQNFESAFNQSFSIALLIEVAEKVATKEMSNSVEYKSQDFFDETQSNTIPQIEILQYEEDSEIISSENNKQTTTHDFSLEEENAFAIKNSNIMKNILKSFQRYIENEKDFDKQEEFCKLANKKNYSQLVKLLKKNLKVYGKRWNMKVMHMVEKDSFKMLLRYFLQNIESIWLNNSKVQNKEAHLKVVNFLIQVIDNPTNTQKLKFYQKRRKMQQL